MASDAAELAPRLRGAARRPIAASETALRPAITATRRGSENADREPVRPQGPPMYSKGGLPKRRMPR